MYLMQTTTLCRFFVYDPGAFDNNILVSNKYTPHYERKKMAHHKGNLKFVLNECFISTKYVKTCSINIWILTFSQ